MRVLENIKQLVRYGFVGLVSNLAGYLLYLILTALIFPPKLTMTLLYIAAATIGFFGHRSFTFKHDGSLSGSALAYGIVHTFGWALNFSLLYVFVDVLNYPHQIVQAGSILVVALYLFIAMRIFVFPDRHSERVVQQ